MLTVVAPPSLQSWYRQYAGTQTEALFIGEGADDPISLAEQVAAQATSRCLRILSGHDSLLRDWILAKELRASGFDVASQSGMATAAAVDKLLQKRILALAGVGVPQWGLDRTYPNYRSVLSKGRASTQSRGLRWCAPGDPIGPDRYWEVFVRGVEYSAVLYRDHDRTTVFPLVWKGAVQTDLMPPWRRLRLVPADADDQLATLLTKTCLQIADLLDIWGFAEVEFIVPPEGPPVVIDINPRICGTIRIVAMATDIELFDPAQLPTSGRRPLPVLRYVAEVPYDGTPFATERIVASSRLTCAGDSPAEVKGVLASHGFAVSQALWPRKWRDD